MTKLVYGNLSVLLTGNAGIPAELDMVAGDAPLASTVLNAGHRGSKASTGEAFLAAVNPGIAVIQVGAENDYGHPSPEALGRLAGGWSTLRFPTGTTLEPTLKAPRGPGWLWYTCVDGCRVKVDIGCCAMNAQGVCDER